MIDRFGKKIPIIPVDEDHFKTTVTVAFSPKFIGWVLSMGDGVIVAGPSEIVSEISAKISQLQRLYS